jgi:MFS family permease
MDLILPPGTGTEARLLLLARGLRAAADGWISIVLPTYLLAVGLDALRIGVLATATMLGSAALTLGVGFLADRLDPRRTLLAASWLMAATGLAFALAGGFWPLLLVAFVGTLNPSSGDVSLFLPLEQSLLAQSTAERHRTALFARYSLVGAACGAFGTLLAALPEAAGRVGVPILPALQAMFVLYGTVGIAAWLLYRRLPKKAPTGAWAPAPVGPSRRIVYELAALFSVDSFAGGLVVQSLLALWLFDAFGLSLTVAAQLFFWTGILSAASFLVAPALARRIGLIRTMVFTHLPANLCLVLVPFTTALWQAVALLLVRSLLSQMDVPARTSYVMAVVTPAERPAAASLTNVPRSLAAASSPTLAGWLLGVSAFGWPLLLAGALKIAYDLALLARFRHVRPPEERGG